jgi:hypothetical protein
MANINKIFKIENSHESKAFGNTQENEGGGEFPTLQKI